LLHSLHDSLQVQARRFLFFIIPNKMMLRFFFLFFLIPNKMMLRFFFFSFSFQTKWFQLSFPFLSHSKQNDFNFLFLFFLIPNKMISTFFLVHPREYQMTRLYETNPKKIYSSFFFLVLKRIKHFCFSQSFGILVFIIIETILRRDDSHFSTFSFAIIWMVKYSVFILRE
jgi:hypothetical protein